MDAPSCSTTKVQPGEHVTLTDFESSTLMGLQRGLTTITFFQVRAESGAKFIRERLRAIAKVNPWITGRVVQDNEAKNLQLAYSSAGPGHIDVTELTLDDLIRFNPGNLKIHSKMPYEELRDAVIESQAQLPKGNRLVNKQDLVLRITIAPDCINASVEFAVIVSMSHAIGDGYTYYAIIRMLSEGGVIRSLSPRRNPEVITRCEKARKAESPYVRSFTNMCSVFWKLIFAPKKKYFAYYVDKSRVNEYKNEVKARGVEFVSTNDILTSTFASLTQSRLCFMAMNLRNRVKGATDDDAGNYQCLLGLDSDVYGCPERIRGALLEGPPFVAHKRPFPGIWEAVNSKIGVTSNWVSFASHINLPGCKHVLQIPSIDCLYECAIIFAPKPDEFAVLYGMSSDNHKNLCKIAATGRSVSHSMFTL